MAGNRINPTSIEVSLSTESGTSQGASPAPPYPVTSDVHHSKPTPQYPPPEYSPPHSPPSYSNVFGSQPDSNYEYIGIQPYSGASMTQQQLQYPPVPVTHIRNNNLANPDEAVGAIILSCFVFWCCGCLFGSVAFILGVIACNTAHKKSKAHCLAVASYTVSAIGISLALAAIIVFLTGVLRVTTNPCKSGHFFIDNKCYDHRSFNFFPTSCTAAGGYYSTDGYCYFSSPCSGAQYYVPAAAQSCYNHRSMVLTSSACTSLGAYFSSEDFYCYYNN